MESSWSIYLSKENKEINLDKKDLLILETLLENSRTTLTTLNKITNLSKVAIINRLKNLEKERIILGYSTLVNTHNLGYDMFTLMIKTKMTLVEKEEFIEYLKKIPFLNQIITPYSCDWDFILRIYANDQNGDKIISMITRFGKISDLEILYLDEWFWKGKKNLFIPLNLNDFCIKEDSSFNKTFKNKKIKAQFDKKDLEILYYLSNNARISYIDLGKKVNLSPDTISYRLKKLIQGNAIGSFSLMIDTYLLGFTPYLLNLQVYNRINTQKIINFLLNNTKTTGILQFKNSWNIQAYLLIKKPSELKQIEEALVKEFGEDINDYNFIQLKEQPYFEYFPREFIEAE
jgi:Lrp/AsnC family leucine-responsive transcriptional regulator